MTATIPTGPRRRSRSTRSSTARNDRFEARHGDVCAKWKVPIVITSLGARTELNDAVHWLGRDHAPRHHRRPLRAQGGRKRRRRADRGRRRRRRPCRALVAVRVGPGNPRLVRRAAGACRARSPPAARSSPRRRWAPTSPISARRSSPPTKPMPATPTSRGSSTAARPTSSTPTCSPACTAIICARRSSMPGSTRRACQRGDLEAMKFGSDGSGKSKAWRDIWGSGQGIGAVDRVLPGGRAGRAAGSANMRRRRRGCAPARA